MESIWNHNGELPERKCLQKDINVHTVVIGAGMAGILTAYFLKKRGIEVVVVEAKRIAGGQTGGTTAKITSQHALIYDTLIRKVGREKAKAYAQANEEAIRLFGQLVEEEKISCHFEKLPAYLYTLQEKGLDVLRKEAEAAAALGIPAYYTEGHRITELPFQVKGAVCFENQAQFHPLKLIKHLAEELVIYENTKVLSVKKHMVFTDKGNIRAENIVFAAHYPFMNLPGFYFLRQHQERSYVLALEGQKALSGMYYSIDENGLSLRSAGDVLLFGGGGHRSGALKAGKGDLEPKACEHKTTGYSYLRKMAQVYYPDVKEAGAWSAQDCMPHDEIPFIGNYSMIRPYWYVATGFKKWGMTSAMIAAVIISNKICGYSVPYDKVFSPQRLLLRASFRNFMIDMGESLSGLGKGLFSKKKRRCPHMGCRLEWNGEEGSWDCPCHGSRFGCRGELIDNPAQIDLEEKK